MLQSGEKWVVVLLCEEAFDIAFPPKEMPSKLLLTVRQAVSQLAFEYQFVT